MKHKGGPIYWVHEMREEPKRLTALRESLSGYNDLFHRAERIGKQLDAVRRFIGWADHPSLWDMERENDEIKRRANLIVNALVLAIEEEERNN